jgi:hypothetical protein
VKIGTAYAAVCHLESDFVSATCSALL